MASLIPRSEEPGHILHWPLGTEQRRHGSNTYGDLHMRDPGHFAQGCPVPQGARRGGVSWGAASSSAEGMN